METKKSNQRKRVRSIDEKGLKIARSYHTYLPTPPLLFSFPPSPLSQEQEPDSIMYIIISPHHDDGFQSTG